MQNYIVDSIKNYLDKKEELLQIVDELYKITAHLEESYPEYKKWFCEKQIKGCFTGNRNTIFIRKNGKIVGLVNLKDDDDEKKLCTIYIVEEYRETEVRNLLLTETIKYLKTSKPFITISEDNLVMFKKIIAEYNWQLTEIKENYYRVGSREYCFNGKLSINNKVKKYIKK